MLGQHDLDALNEVVQITLQMYAQGTLTVAELLSTIQSLPKPDHESLAGLIDPNTGLKYPTLRS